MIQFGDLILYDLNEVARRLDMPRARVEGHVRRETLAAVVHGGRWLVAAEEIARFQAHPLRPTFRGRPRRFRPPARPADLPSEG